MARELIDFVARNIKSSKQRVKNYHYYSEDSEFNFVFKKKTLAEWTTERHSIESQEAQSRTLILLGLMRKEKRWKSLYKSEKSMEKRIKIWHLDNTIPLEKHYQMIFMKTWRLINQELMKTRSARLAPSEHTVKTVSVDYQCLCWTPENSYFVPINSIEFSLSVRFTQLSFRDPLRTEDSVVFYYTGKVPKLQVIIASKGLSLCFWGRLFYFHTDALPGGDLYLRFDGQFYFCI